MTGIGKRYNIALIFTVIVLFLCQDISYGNVISSIRVPLEGHKRMGQSLIANAHQDPLFSQNPIREINDAQLIFIGDAREGSLTKTQEVRYIDEHGLEHECFAKWAEVAKEDRYIPPK